MRVLVGKTFGIGNAVMSVPMVKALALVGHDVDVLIGSGPDDIGAHDVFRELRRFGKAPEVGHVWTDGVPFNVPIHDVAILSIPYDGRWRNGIDFFAHRVIDGRRRPDNVERLGFDMWKWHEVLYQIENAIELGFDHMSGIPDCSFMERPSIDHDMVYVGLGFKRDAGGFGASKHIGDERIAGLIREIGRRRPSTRFIATGNQRDAVEVGFPIMRLLGIDPSERQGRFRMDVMSLEKSFRAVGGCHAYLGNDTGMMHVAAAFGLPCLAGFLSEDVVRKNHPFSTRWSSFLVGGDASIDSIAADFIDLAWGNG